MSSIILLVKETLQTNTQLVVWWCCLCIECYFCLFKRSHCRSLIWWCYGVAYVLSMILLIKETSTQFCVVTMLPLLSVIAIVSDNHSFGVIYVVAFAMNIIGLVKET